MKRPVLLLASVFLVAARPPGWDLVSSAPHAYALRTDRQVAHTGRQSARLSSTEETTGFSTASQTIHADRYRGERIRLSAWLRSEACTNWAGLWMRIDNTSGQALSFDNMQDRPLQGDNDWLQVAVVLDVPAEAADISFGALLSGTGTLWIDDVVLERVSQDVPLTNQIIERQQGPRNLSFD